jgi:alpha-beta hydrolase superfamily lysophospholipase
MMIGVRPDAWNPFGLMRIAALGLALVTGACAPRLAPAGPAVAPPALAEDAFVLADGARLPYRAWRPQGAPRAVVLALHGFNDSRNAWEIPAEDFSRAGVLLVAPDQRGFGAAPNRGIFAGAETMADDAAQMARLLRARHPGLPLFLLGESMGGAVAMVAAAQNPPPPVDGVILLAPAVWGRAHMNAVMRGGLWLMAHTVPLLAFQGTAPGIQPSDNAEALRRLSRDPLTLRSTRVDTLKGLVDLMDAALAAGPAMRVPALLLYGGRDDLIPQRPTRALLASLPAGARVAYYDNGYHLLFRGLERAVPIADTLAWMANPAAPLPSGAEAAARRWASR